MKKLLIPFLLSGLLLTGCQPKEVRKLKRGDKVVIDESNVNTYLKINLSYKLKSDAERSIIRMEYTLKTTGYPSLSYFLDKVDCKITFNYLGDNGNITNSHYTISLNPGKDGKAQRFAAYNCNYRSVSDIKLAKCSCTGFVVKK